MLFPEPQPTAVTGSQQRRWKRFLQPHPAGVWRLSQVLGRRQCERAGRRAGGKSQIRLIIRVCLDRMRASAHVRFRQIHACKANQNVYKNLPSCNQRGSSRGGKAGPTRRHCETLRALNSEPSSKRAPNRRALNRSGARSAEPPKQCGAGRRRRSLTRERQAKTCTRTGRVAEK